jgi:hypothetical protein
MTVGFQNASSRVVSALHVRRRLQSPSQLDPRCARAFRPLSQLTLVEADSEISTEGGITIQCAKEAWVEYLGEHPEPILDRIE